MAANFYKICDWKYAKIDIEHNSVYACVILWINSLCNRNQLCVRMNAQNLNDYCDHE